MTKQKRLILEILRSTKSHPTADWIYDQARKVLPSISLGTVYRNLAILKEDGQIMELSYGSTYSRYDGNPENHYHFVCLKCGRVEDVDIPVRGELEREVEKTGVGDVYYHRLEFYGLCAHCRSSRTDKPGGAGEDSR
ncbi:Fur family transcriptional regulator [Thermanaeromonas sp.]|uniref:Fur family transcriptional regulator n=1 Tax=Thermanaeromonas sp. TaxID=2003697 RepID=UPI00262016B9|nr:transcriptional repressor [Thermanaeromonas sp.]